MRHFYMRPNVDYDIVEVSLNYHSLCTWNPEENEGDTAFVFVNDQAVWGSAPQYEFVEQYCQGYSTYSDWTLDLDHLDIMHDPHLIQCLTLLDQICTYPVSFSFRHDVEVEGLYFSVGLGALLNQQIGNEAWGFSNVEISYEHCPILEPTSL